MRADDVAHLGENRLAVTRLGLGTAWLGNMYAPIDDSAATAVVHRALRLGMRLIDTAPLYGYGLAESRLREALSGVPRDCFVLATKVGRTLRPWAPGDPELKSYDGAGSLFVNAPRMHAGFDFSYDAALRGIEDSLGRLGLDRLDVALIHDPDDHFPQALDGAYRALRRLKDERAVGAIGVGMNQAAMLTRFAREADLDLVLLAGEYTLLDQTGLDELLPTCQARRVSVVLGGVYNTGILADPSPGACYKYQVAPADILQRAQRMQAVCTRYETPLPAAAVQFPFAHPAVTAVLMGVRSAAELEENVAMLQRPIPAQLWTDLRSEGLLPDHVPVPG
jgi:D-threo-aldose 1-dehydrogenase